MILDNNENKQENKNLLLSSKKSSSKILNISDKSSLYVDSKTGSIVQGRKRNNINELKHFIGKN